MKYLIIIGDGMADYPIKNIGNLTPLMAANKPNIDELARKGRNGRLKTIPDNLPTGSAVANLSILGYDPEKYFQGRGVLEAACMGINLTQDDLVLRSNLICIENDRIKNHSAGHISTGESQEIIKTLNQELANGQFYFKTGFGYRHILVIKKGSQKLDCLPPHDIPGVYFKEALVRPLSPEARSTAELINHLIMGSRDLLENHPVNLKRKQNLLDPANSIWPWSPGKKPKMPYFKQLFGLQGAVISAVDLIKGIGIYAGMEVIEVKGATGLYNTNYEGKAKAAVEALAKNDLVYLHVEASDEAGHEGDYHLKIRTIEFLDDRIVKYIIDHLPQVKDDVTIAILPDHPTPCELRSHVRDSVPFIIFNPHLPADHVQRFDEITSRKGYYREIKGAEFLDLLLSS